MPKICFVPIWHPLEDYVTSRLRAKYVAELLAGQDGLDVALEYRADADIAVMVQLCSDRNYREICNNEKQQVVYDICDRYFETDNVFLTDEGPINAGERCLDLIRRANVLIAPTRQLKGELARRFPDKPCYYVPELVDYEASPQPASGMGSRRLLWFGHPTRGNFESVRWIIDYLKARYGYLPVLVTNPWTLAKEYPAYAQYCQPWSLETMRREFARAELCVVSHAADEPSKSANRFVTATMHGIPTLVSGSPSCIEILDAAGYGEFAIEAPRNIDRAIAMLSNPRQRAAYVSDLQKEMWQRHAPAVVRGEYLRLMRDVGPAAPPAGRALSLGLVTSLSDTARTEPFLSGLARGLNSETLAVHVYALEDGPQRNHYKEAAISVDCLGVAASDDNAVSSQARTHFTRFLADRRIDLVICDGPATSRHCQWAMNEGRRAVVLLSAAGTTRPLVVRDDAPAAEVMAALGAADALVFTSEASRTSWKSLGAPENCRTIPMALAPQRFEEAARATRHEARLQLGLPADVVIALWIDEPSPDRSRAPDRLIEGSTGYPLAAHLLRVSRSQTGLRADRLHGPGLPLEGTAVEPALANEATAGLFFRAADFCVIPGGSPGAARDSATAMYFGLPVVFLAPDAGASPIKHPREGFVASDDGSALRYFFQLSTDAKLRVEMGDRAARRFWEGPTYREMLKSFQSMIGELCSRPPAQP